SRATGRDTEDAVPRLLPFRGDVYLEKLGSHAGRVRARVSGRFDLDGRVGWVNEDAVESAGEKCPAVYSPN
ncbi:MAG TPA: hypothetical protein VJ921_15080, partial [Vicinamibacteria bacterium]|nr:hypothetical protein [Vicinamibacteria bacterium]